MIWLKMKHKKVFQILTLSAFLLCFTKGVLADFDDLQDGPPDYAVDVSMIPNAIPKKEPKHRFANPPYYEVFGKRYSVLPSNKGYDKVGTASWYGTKFDGRPTASGETYNMLGMTAASTELPIPSYVEVTNLQNGKQVIVKVNDRGPFHQSRILDLSYAAARKLGIVGRGTAKVEVKAITFEDFAEDNPFFIQIGSFQKYQNAKSFADKIERVSASPTKITTASSTNKTTLYRVQIGPLDSKSSAKKINTKLSLAGITPGFIIAA